MNKRKTCVKCGVFSREKKFEVPGQIFPMLQGSPFLCDRCLYTVLLGDGTSRMWIPEVRPYLTTAP